MPGIDPLMVRVAVVIPAQAGIQARIREHELPEKHDISGDQAADASAGI
jgi:hypothetical protein